MLSNLAVAVNVAWQLIGLVQHQALQEADNLAAFFFAQHSISLARSQRLSAVPADYGVEVETGSVVAIGCRGADAPQRRRSPLTDNAAVKLHLIELRAD